MRFITSFAALAAVAASLTAVEPVPQASPASAAPIVARATLSPAAAMPVYGPSHFARKTICLESTLYRAPLGYVASQLAKAGIRVGTSTVAGGCAKRGYPAGQRIIAKAFAKSDYTKANATTGAYALLYDMNSGHARWEGEIRVNYTSDPTMAKYFRVDHWNGMWLHETLHHVGLDHRPDKENSAMGGEDAMSPTDITRVVNLYKGHSW